MDLNPEEFLLRLFDTAVEAASPHQVLARHLPNDKSARTIVIGAGKAAASMAAALEEAWQGELSGLVVTPYGHTETCKKIEVIEAAHPVPDNAGEIVAKRIMALADGLTAEDQVICLISGGGSALLSLPAPGINLKEKQGINRALLKSGATIIEINCVRKHLSAIKGGRLALACSPAQVHTYAISDVPGDDAQVIASGLTVADDSTSAQALDILHQYEIEVPDNVLKWLNSAESETPKSDHPAFANTTFTMIATPQQSLDAAAECARNADIPVMILSDCIEGESREVAKVHAAIARQVAKYGQPLQAPCVILSGGETTVTVKGNGRGGRNAEFLLSFFNSLKGQANIYALATDTDGIDGSEDNAGAMITPETWLRAKRLGLESSEFLDNNDGYSFFLATDSLIATGPTRTNVNDFRAILILPKNHTT
jgi:glycerate 2-kinase|tara:strand:+ start:2003 stop:3283 length:1281 start_codon:yes stop_codon:yes gene_type:complete